MREIHNLRIPEIALTKWRSISDLMAEIAGVPASGISIVEGDSIRVIESVHAPRGGGPGETSYKFQPGMKSYCAGVVHAREKLIIRDATRSDFWKDSDGAKAGFIAYAGVPIFQPDREIFGTLCLFDSKPNDFSGPTVRLMEEFADIITGHLELIQANLKLEETLKDVRTLQGLIPICAQCKKIRNDKGYWQKVEVYLEEHSQARFTHGLCEDCMQKLYGHEKWFKEPDKTDKDKPDKPGK